MAKPIIIHDRRSTCKGKMRSSLRLFVTCARCQRKYWPDLVMISVRHLTRTQQQQREQRYR